MNLPAQPAAPADADAGRAPHCGERAIGSAAFERTRQRAVQRLLAARHEQGHWVGELSTSALATATAVFALAQVDADTHRKQIDAGLAWLIRGQNADGGWGDTDRSLSNISTTMLVWSALTVARTSTAGAADAAARCEAWLARAAGSLERDALVHAIVKRYGRDRTFSVPILTMSALSGRLGPPADPATWRCVPQLPFELAAFPMRWFRWLRMPVVSYALPALIAIGQLRHHRRPTWNPIARIVRNTVKERTLNVLTSVQPSTGGFLEATPLTSFVIMSLAAAGQREHGVVKQGIRFLQASVRPDGGWPIDTNLATWVTTLAINALAGGGNLQSHLDGNACSALRDWLLDRQYQTIHPYTGAAPGGWAWTPLSGGVPDADDTSGALLALHHLGPLDDRSRHAAQLGLRWLEQLRNRDGGLPTFCHGWGRLPFDRSSTDITAHGLRAQTANTPHADSALDTRRCEAFILSQQRPDGSWLPLWFGNQHLPDESNGVYGTSRMLVALAEHGTGELAAAAARGARWLIDVQNADGGWGGGRGPRSSIEETALVLEALATRPLELEVDVAIDRGARWLMANTDEGERFDPAPIGFYFAKLWYYERLYPLIFTVAALERLARRVESP